MSNLSDDALRERARELQRVYNDVEEAQAQRFYGEHAHDEWENLAPAEVELWLTLAKHVESLRDAALGIECEQCGHIRGEVDKA
mgnify:CR=1 FL=1